MEKSERIFQLAKGTGSCVPHPNIMVDVISWEIVRIHTILPPQFVFEAVHRDGSVFIHRYRKGKWEDVLIERLERIIQRKMEKREKQRQKRARIKEEGFSPAKWWWL